MPWSCSTPPVRNVPNLNCISSSRRTRSHTCHTSCQAAECIKSNKWWGDQNFPFLTQKHNVCKLIFGACRAGMFVAMQRFQWRAAAARPCSPCEWCIAAMLVFLLLFLVFWVFGFFLPLPVPDLELQQNILKAISCCSLKGTSAGNGFLSRAERWLWEAALKSKRGEQMWRAAVFEMMKKLLFAKIWYNLYWRHFVKVSKQGYFYRFVAQLSTLWSLCSELSTFMYILDVLFTITTNASRCSSINSSPIVWINSHVGKNLNHKA